MEPIGAVDSSAFVAGVELGETYAELSEDWAALYDRAFAIVSQPELLKTAEDLDAAFESYGDSMAELPATPVTDQLVELEERALVSLARAYEQLAMLPVNAGSEALVPVVRHLVEAGATHEAARAAVSGYLESLGLDFGV